MAETYIEIVAGERALHLDEEIALAGNTLVSVETDEENTEASVYEFIQQNFPEFLKMLRRLSPEDQEFLLEYYVLGKTQTQMGIIHKITQTQCSLHIRLAVKKLLGYLMLGEITQPVVAAVMKEAGIADEKIGNKAPLSHVVFEYDFSRSFAKVAYKWGIHRPLVRRALVKLRHELLKHTGRPAALGAFLHAMLDGASAEGTGKSKRQRLKRANMLLKTPDICGEFRLDASHPDLDHMFVSRAVRG